MKRPVDDFEHVWRRRFERFARAHDDDAGIAGWSAGGLAARMRRFAEIWTARETPRPGATWLDAGCGAGTYTRRLASQGLLVTAVDYSQPTTFKARERGPDGVSWVTADVTRLPFRDGQFDGVLCFGVMQALGSPERALLELRRVVRPDAPVWVDALNAHFVPSVVTETWRSVRGRAPHLRYDSPAAFRAAMEASGFGAVEIHWVPILPGRLRLLQSVVEAAPVRLLLAALPFLGAALSHSFLVRARASLERASLKAN